MKRYLRDTTPLTAYFRARSAVVSLLNSLLERPEVCTSSLVYAEVSEYNRGFSDYARRQAELRRLLREITPFVLTYSILERYGVIRRQLRPPRGPGLIGDIDTLIAATALRWDLTLITTDSDFERVPDIKLLLLPRVP